MTAVDKGVRTGRVARNDALIADAVVAVLAEGGVGQLTAAEVARRAGMSKRPVLVRYPDRSSLSVAGWAECGPVLAAALAGIVHASTRAERIGAWERLQRPVASLRAAAELVVAASFDPVLADAVSVTLGAELQVLIDGTPQERARRAYLIGTGLGLLWMSRYPGVAEVDFSEEYARIDAAVRDGRDPVELPDPPAPHLDDTAIETGDSITDALLRATCEVVGASGFDAATAARIAAAAGVSEGALFRRYPSKLALFLDATRHQQHMALRANEAFLAELAERYSRGTAEAVTIKQFCRADRASLRSLLLEQLRISWHDADLLAASANEIDEFVQQVVAQRRDVKEDRLRAYTLIGVAIGTGMPVLAALHPAAQDYPYDVVTIPLED